MTVCNDCDEILICENCSAPMVLYTSRDGKKRIFICNRCKSQKDSSTTCPRCKSWNLVPLGIGTDTIIKDIEKNFPKVKIFKLDKESVRTKKEIEKTIKSFENSKGSILVGTEMALFYLNHEVPLSIVASFDSLWSIPNFRINEIILKLMVSIMLLTKEEIIIQTKNENEPVLNALKSENISLFVRAELADRKKFNYPPYKRFIKIKHMGSKEDVVKVKKELTLLFGEYDLDIFSGFVAKQKNKYITNALIRLDIEKWSLPELSMNSSIDNELLKKLTTLPPSYEVIIDPEDLL